mgnify:CR=1 FL=1
MSDIIGNKTLKDQWAEAAREWPKNLFVIFEDRDGHTFQANYKEFYRSINRASNMFASFGVKKGEPVAVQLCNSPEFLLCWFGLAQIGAVVVPLNTGYKQAEVNYILEKCEARIVVTEPRFVNNFTTDGTNGVEKLIVARGECSVQNELSFSALLDTYPDELTEARPINSEDIFEILFTSGTTSYPKGVVMTHCNALFAGQVHAWQCSLSPGDRFFTTMPCFHIDFQYMAVMSALTVGGTVVIAEKFSATNYWRQICQYRANVADMMPFLVRTVMSKPVQPWEKNHVLKNIYFSMGMGTKEKETFEDRFGVRFLNCYGSTETVSCVTGDPAFGARKWPSVGKAALGYEIKIVGSDGQELGPGEVGSIRVKGIRGRSLAAGYYKDPEATDKRFSGDWYITGDDGYLDEEGWLYFSDRHSNMIKRSGESVSTTEVENILTTHPCVADAAVFGIPDPLRGQAVKAVVQLRDGEQLSPEDIICYCSKYLADFKLPSVVEFCKEFPRTSTGKIKKNLLK